MPDRNYEYWTPVETALDGRRYRWRVHPAGEAPLVTPTQGTLHPLFAPPLKHTMKLDKTPFGLASYETMKFTGDLASISNSPLYTHLQDEGAIVWGDLSIRTVWTLFSDRGNRELDAEDFEAIYVGVQVAQIPQEIRGNRDKDELTIDIELVHAMKVVLEAVTPAHWSSEIRRHVPDLAQGSDGVSSPFYEARKREMCYDLLFRDGLLVYAKATRRSGEEGVWLRHLDIYQGLEDLLSRVYQNLMRSASSTFSLRSLKYPGELGTPHDYRINYKQAHTTTAARGEALPRTNRWILAANRKTGTNILLQGFLAPNDGISKDYSSGNCLLLLKDQTEEGGCRGRFVVNGTRETGVNAYIEWRALWDRSDSIAPTAMPETHQYLPGFTTTPGGNYVSGCDVQMMLPRGKNPKEFKWSVGGMSDQVRPYQIKMTLTTMPCAGDYNKDAYYIAADTRQFGGIATEANYDFAHAWFIIAHPGFTVNRWFYFEEPVSSGGPSWIIGSASIAVACHHHTTFDLGGLAGDYEPSDDEQEFNLPTFVEVNKDAAFYQSYANRLWGAIAELQKRCDAPILAKTIGRIFGSRGQGITKVQIPRPNVWSDNPFAVFPWTPSEFRAGLLPACGSDSLIVDIESDYGVSVDTLVIYTKQTTT